MKNRKAYFILASNNEIKYESSLMALVEIAWIALDSPSQSL